MNFFSCFFFLFLNCCNEITIFQKYYLVKIHNELKIARNKIVAKIGEKSPIIAIRVSGNDRFITSSLLELFTSNNFEDVVEAILFLVYRSLRYFHLVRRGCNRYGPNRGNNRDTYANYPNIEYLFTEQPTLLRYHITKQDAR